ncbi:MAG TPA: type II secretion system protein [Gemmataceae bacterium]
MRQCRHASHRDGFSLIELLVVISILGILVALTAAGIGRVRLGQQARITDQTLTKLQKGLDLQVIAVIDEAIKESNPNLGSLIPFCDGDKDRAKALLAYAYMKREFPQTFAEARFSMPVGVGLQPHKAFNTITSNVSGVTPAEEAAILLYIILQEKGNRGQVMPVDDSTNAAQSTIATAIGTFKVFKDGYGTPITFQRWMGPGNPELQNAPYINPKETLNTRTGGSVDPFDRLGKLAMLAPMIVPPQTWPKSGVVNRNAALGILNGAAPGPAGAPTPGVNFDGLYKMPSVISAGQDLALGTPDDVPGYRLVRFGNKGN